MRITTASMIVPADFGPCAPHIGNFDGVHFGHRAFSGGSSRWPMPALEASVLTFDPHPTRVVAPKRTPAC